jgi:peptide/nickel transport system permease protein
MAIDTLPNAALPSRSGPSFGFLTATPIIAVATVCLALVILSAIFATCWRAFCMAAASHC